MGFSFNQGGTPLTRLETNDSPNSMGNVADKQFTVCARFASANFSAARFLWSTLDQSNFLQYFAVEVANSTTLKVRIPRAGGDSTHTLTVPAMTASTSTFYDLVMQVGVVTVNGVATGEREVVAYFRATAAGSAGFFQGAEEPLTDDGLGSGAELSGTGVFYWGNDGSDGDGASRGFVGNVTDLALFEGTLSPQDIENFGKGWSPLQFVSATLRSCPMNVNGAALDCVPGAAVALTVGGTAQFTSEATLWDGPKTDTTAEFGYVTTNHLVSISVGSASRPSIGYDTSTTRGNMVCAIDESGHGIMGRTSAGVNYRHRFKIDPVTGDRRFASVFTDAVGGPTWMQFNNSPHVVSNRGITIGIVHAKNTANVQATDNTALICNVGAGRAVCLATDADGYLNVWFQGSPGAGCKPLLANGKGIRVLSRPTAYIVTIASGAGGTAVRTVTVYSAEGTATCDSPSYASNDVGTIQYLGPNAVTSNRGQYGVFKAFDVWSSALSAANAATQLAAYQNRFNLPTSYTGLIVHVGDSIVEGSCTDRCTGATALYQLAGNVGPRVRCVGHGHINTTIATHRLTVAAGTAYAGATYAAGVFVDGATCTQGSATCRIAYQNGTQLYIYDWNGTNFDTTGTVPLVQGAVSRNVTAQSSTDPANALFRTGATERAGILKTLANEFSGQRVVWIRAATNAIASGWAFADVIEVEKCFVAWLKTNCPGVWVFMATCIPRTPHGSYGANLQSYNAALRAVDTLGGWWDDVTDHSVHAPFDFKDASFTPDNGAYDYGNDTYFLPDDVPSGNDGTHPNETGNALFAADGSLAFGSITTGEPTGDGVPSRIPYWTASCI